MELRYLRDTDKREVDFVILKDRKPLFAVECKSSEPSTGEEKIGAALPYFAERTTIPVFYQVHLGEDSYDSGKVRVRPFRNFCAELALP